MIRPFSATLSTTYGANEITYPAPLSIDNDPATFAEAHPDDTASWLMMTFSNIDLQVKEVTLVLISTAITGMDDQTVKLVAVFMTDAVVYVVDTAQKKHKCGILELNLDDVSAEGQTYSLPCAVLGSQVRVESSAGTIDFYGTEENKHVLVAEGIVTVLHSQNGEFLAGPHSLITINQSINQNCRW